MRLCWYQVNVSSLLSIDTGLALKTYTPKCKDDKLWWEIPELGLTTVRQSWVIHRKRAGARKVRRYLRRHDQRLQAWGVLSKRTGYLERPSTWSTAPRDSNGPPDPTFHLLWVLSKLLKIEKPSV